MPLCAFSAIQCVRGKIPPPISNSHNGRFAEHTAAKTGNISNPVGSVRRLLVDFWRIVAAILLPPLGVFLQVGLTKHFWINILLTLLGYIPGIVHAVWVIAKY